MHYKTAIALALIAIIISIGHYVTRQSIDLYDGVTGLEPTKCWFGGRFSSVSANCYYMHSLEDHSKPAGRTIKFPVVIFRSAWSIIRNNIGGKKAPVLMLGGGGPGAPMFLDNVESVNFALETLDDISVKQNRDLIIIDPRGTGLAKPLLTCKEFINNEKARLQKNHTWKQLYDLQHQDYIKCINRLLMEDIDLNQYNTTAVAQDIELLRAALNIERWVLLGVSYAGVYAQIIASENPDTVESLILDSTAFPNIPLHHQYSNRIVANYRSLYNYCASDTSCSYQKPDIRSQLWRLFDELNKQPLVVATSAGHKNSNGDTQIDMVLNGSRMIEVLLNAIYSTEIFADLPTLLDELERGSTRKIRPYVDDYVAFMLEPTWGDVSSISHYCHETKPFIDVDKIRKELKNLPSGFIRDWHTLLFEMDDHCEKINGNNLVANKDFDDHKVISTPTLFLHGKFDTITPFSDVKREKHRFTQSRTITFDTAHSVITADECAEIAASDFNKNQHALVLGC